MIGRTLAALAAVHGAAAQVVRHIGAECPDGECPPGMFCNFDGTPFCEACLDCGDPSDGWAGCTSCGLPGAGAADCTASCNADPDIIAANQWRVTNGQQIGDHWVLGEVSMYTVRLIPSPASCAPLLPDVDNRRRCAGPRLHNEGQPLVDGLLLHGLRHCMRKRHLLPYPR